MWLTHHFHISLGTSSEVECTTQVKVPAMGPHSKDAVFALLDGGRSMEAPEALKVSLAGIVEEEMKKEEEEAKAGHHKIDPSLYLTHAFLAAHR